uniref:Thymidine kinase n=1 Tax=Rhodnius prolixus TaxID=13249 RepID=T1I162_RHOPR
MDKVHTKGKLEVILGPVFSGKTSELIRRIQRYYFAGFRTLVIRFTTNDDYFVDSLITHDGYKLEAIFTSSLLAVHNFAAEFDVIGIDEAHYFTDLIEFCSDASDNGKKVIVAALDSDYERQGYPHVLGLVPMAENVNKLLAICVSCFQDAPFSRKIQHNTSEARKNVVMSVCEDCFFLPSPTIRNKSILEKFIPIKT